ncbi:MAG: hypothetical protein JWR61_4830 [Ferruginibacter sp.]|nr:hypothetical protein [Ferruginibacter sp.]
MYKQCKVFEREVMPVCLMMAVLILIRLIKKGTKKAAVCKGRLPAAATENTYSVIFVLSVLPALIVRYFCFGS